MTTTTQAVRMPRSDQARSKVLDLEALAKAYKNPVRVATTASITLSAAQTIDTIAAAQPNRALVKDQADPTQNGIYEMKGDVWVRAADADHADKLPAGTLVYVQEGAVNGGTWWWLSTTGTIVLGATAVTWLSLTERVQDIVGGFLAGSTNITVSYDDAGNALTVTATGLVTSAALTESVQDIVGALTGFGGTGLTFSYNDAGDTLTLAVNFATNAQALTATSAILALTPANLRGAGVLGNPMFGDGGDGDVVNAGAVTLTRDMQYNDLSGTGSIDTAGFRIMVRGRLSGSLTIKADGGNGAAGGAAGAAHGGNFYGASAIGGAGGATTGGAAGTIATAVGLGGTGGAGGNGTSGNGASGGTTVAVVIGAIGALGTNIAALTLWNARGINTAGAVIVFRGGTGGGGGGGDGTAGGGGGGGGSFACVFARDASAFTGSVTANGGNGGTPAAGSRGGGGGGGGGVALLACSVAPTGSYTVTANGGTKGTKSGTGTDGVDGNAGLAMTKVVSAA